MKTTILKSFKLTLLFFTFQCHIANGQTDFKKNDFYIEAGGNGMIYSLNYERQLFRKPGLGIRAGVGWLPNLYFAVPLGLNYLFDIRHGNFIETGAGLTIRRHYIGWRRNESNLFIPSIAFRRHTTKNLLLRLSALGVLYSKGYQQGVKFNPWVGLSVGKRF